MIVHHRVSHHGTFILFGMPALNKNSKGSWKTFVVRLPKNFIKSQVPGSEMKFIAVKKQVSIVFRHVMFCVSQVGLL